MLCLALLSLAPCTQAVPSGPGSGAQKVLQAAAAAGEPEEGDPGQSQRQLASLANSVAERVGRAEERWAGLQAVGASLVPAAGPEPDGSGLHGGLLATAARQTAGGAAETADAAARRRYCEALEEFRFELVPGLLRRYEEGGSARPGGLWLAHMRARGGAIWA